MHLFDTKSLYTKVLEVKHNLQQQVACAGNGRGEYSIVEGHPQVHAVVLEFLKLDIVWRVVCDTDYFIITVGEPRRWKEIEGIVQHIAARHIDVENK